MLKLDDAFVILEILKKLEICDFNFKIKYLLSKNIEILKKELNFLDTFVNSEKLKVYNSLDNQLSEQERIEQTNKTLEEQNFKEKIFDVLNTKSNIKKEDFLTISFEDIEKMPCPLKFSDLSILFENNILK